MRFQRENKKGSILVVALWSLSILTAFAVTAGYQVRQRITLADRIDSRNWLHGIAEMGVAQAIGELTKHDSTEGYDPMSDWVSNPRSFRHVSTAEGSYSVAYETLDSNGGIELRYGPEDESGKINLNTADARILSRLFQTAAGLDEDKANEIAYGAVDWRDSDSFLSDPTYGFEDGYEDLDIPYHVKNRPFEVLDELLLVHGMTPEIFEKIKKAVTVYGSGAVNVNTASKEVLTALGLEESLAKKIVDYRKGSDRKEPSGDDQAFVQVAFIATTLAGQQLSGADQAALNDLIAKGLIGVNATAFHIHSVGESEAKQKALDIDAVVERSGKVLFWSAGIPRQMTVGEIKNFSKSAFEGEETAEA